MMKTKFYITFLPKYIIYLAQLVSPVNSPAHGPQVDDDSAAPVLRHGRSS